jgi:uncharacterized membrane protein YphA (DoxX/SURF4 family)
LYPQTSNMKNYTAVFQLYLRLALGIGYLSAGLDRFGVWGPPGGAAIAWGDWQHFMEYAHKLLFFLPYKLAEVCAFIASVGEIVFGILLIIGWKTRLSAIGSGILALLFALGMAVGLRFRAPLDYSVYVVSAGSFLLATLPFYRWSVDAALEPDSQQSAVKQPNEAMQAE